MSIVSNENKELLLQLLDNHPLKKQNNSKFNNLFEEHIEIINKNRFSYDNLTEMNKELLNVFQKIANKMNNENFIQLNPNPPNSTMLRDSKPIPKIKILEERLKIQQSDFNKMNNPKKPKEIDFSDNIEESYIENSMVDSTMKKREEELKKIMEEYDSKPKDAENWIKNGGKNVNLDISEKKVTFSDQNLKSTPEVSSNNLFNKLKIKNNDEKSSNKNISLLNELIVIENKMLENQNKMLKNQNTIIEELKSLNNKD